MGTPFNMKKIWHITILTATLFAAAYFIFTTVLYGPDSLHSRNGFIRHVGYPPPPSVSGIYYWYEDLWLDPTYRLRFETSDPDVVEQFVKTQKLQECKEQISYIGGPDQKWWTDKNSRSNLKCFSREIPQNFWHLWYDPVSGTVWYEEYST